MACQKIKELIFRPITELAGLIGALAGLKCCRTKLQLVRRSPFGLVRSQIQLPGMPLSITHQSTDGLDSFATEMASKQRHLVASGVYTVSLLQVQDEALAGLETRLKALSVYTTELSTFEVDDARYAELQALIADIERETSWFVGFNAVAKTGEISIDTRSVDGSPVPVTEVKLFTARIVVHGFGGRIE